MSPCEWCGKQYTPHSMTPKGRQRFCSARCRAQYHWYESQARKSEIEQSIANHPSSQGEKS